MAKKFKKARRKLFNWQSLAVVVLALIIYWANCTIKSRYKHLKKLSLLLVSHELTTTGAPLSLLDIALHYSSLGHQIEVISLRGGALRTAYQNAGIPVSLYRHPHSVLSPADIGKFDIIIANTVVADDWIEQNANAHGKAFLRKLVWFIRELPYSENGRQMYLEDNKERKLKLLSECAAGIFVSNASMDAYVQEMQKDKHISQKISHLITLNNPIPRSVPPSAIEICGRQHDVWGMHEIRKLHRLKLNALEADIVVLHVGKFSKYKGSPAVLHAVQAASRSTRTSDGQVHLVLLGEVEVDLQLIVKTAQARSQGSRLVVHSLGSESNFQTIVGWYAAADIAAFNPECEAFGRVFLESMAFSLPLLTTRCGGALDIVKHEKTGLFHTSDDELEGNIAKLLGDKELRLFMGKHGCQRAKALFGRSPYFNQLDEIVYAVALNTK